MLLNEQKLQPEIDLVFWIGFFISVGSSEVLIKLSAYFYMDNAKDKGKTNILHVLESHLMYNYNKVPLFHEERKALKVRVS